MLQLEELHKPRLTGIEFGNISLLLKLNYKTNY